MQKNDNDQKWSIKIHGFKLIIYTQTVSFWKFYHTICNGMSNFDKGHYIPCLRAAFGAKHVISPLSLTNSWEMEPDFGWWQSADISRSHLYHGTLLGTHQPRYIESTLYIRRTYCASIFLDYDIDDLALEIQRSCVKQSIYRLFSARLRYLHC